MTSLEKIEAFKQLLLGGDEAFEGLLGAVQGALGIAELTGKDLLAELPSDPAELDEKLLEVAAFVLWLRSDGAELPEPHLLLELGPQLIAEAAAEHGIGV